MGSPANFNSILNNTNCRCSVTPADRDAELNRLKALVEKLANKVNAPGGTPEVRLRSGRPRQRGGPAWRPSRHRLGPSRHVDVHRHRLLHAAARLRWWRAGGP
jgi:hypothetical protein